MVSGFPANTLIPFQRLTFARVRLRELFVTQKTSFSLPHDGLLKENPPQIRSRSIRVEHIHIIVSKLITPDNMVVATHGFSTIMTKLIKHRNN